MISDGDGSIVISGDVSTTTAADDEWPRADPDEELPHEPNASPPTMDLSPENVIALYQLYDHTILPRHIAQQPDHHQPNRGAAADDFFFVFAAAVEPRNRDAAAADDEYGSSFFIVGAVPASGAAIASLPATTVGEDDGDGDGDWGGECAVCLEEYDAGDAVRTTPCAHGFHERCIFQWLSASRLCPLCRFALPPEEEDTDSDDEEGDGGGNGNRNRALDHLSNHMS